MRGSLVRSFAVFVSIIAGEDHAAAQPVESCNDAPAVNAFELRFNQAWNGAALPLSVMREYLDLKWSERAVETVDLLPAAEMLAAIAAVKDQAPPKGDYAPYEAYSPPGGPQPPYEYAYDEAAGHYRMRNFVEAIPLFDAIAADKRSPYRAAAAYSAARAALLLGRYADGIKRLDRLVADPLLSEFRAAALKLVGTLQYQHGSEPLMAARFAQIAYLIAAPPSLACRYPALAPLVAEAQSDLAWLENQKSPDPREAANDPPISHVMDQLAPTMPLIDLLRVTGSPTPFGQNFGWSDDFSFVGWPELRLRSRLLYRSQFATYDPNPVAARAKELTAHARKRWQETKNVLWAHALAARTTDIADLAILKEALATLGTEPPTPEKRLTNLFLRRHLTAQGARILLMAGQADQAIAFVRDELAVVKRLSEIQFLRWYGGSDTGQWSASFVLDGGIRWFLQRRDLAGARKWARDAAEVLSADARRLFGTKLRPEVQLEVLLAAEPKELVASTLFEGQTSYGSGESLFAAADLLPAKTLVEMSADRKVAPDIRRALLAAGWTRLHLLDRDEEAMALLPRVRELFPELEGDIDDIANASFTFTRDRAITRMLLRAPGFQPRARWFRRGRQVQSIFAIASGNPSDGNWWCPLDARLLKADMALDYFANPLRAAPVQIAWFDSYFARPEKDRAVLVALADDVIAWHPLFKAIDKAELEALARIDSGPKMLTEQAVAWADWSNWFTWALGYDNDLPETLHLAVRSTRYGCRRAGSHGAYSRAAFDHLHDSYPSSEWTKKTPYWFDQPLKR